MLFHLTILFSKRRKYYVGRLCELISSLFLLPLFKVNTDEMFYLQSPFLYKEFHDVKIASSNVANALKTRSMDNASSSSSSKRLEKKRENSAANTNSTNDLGMTKSIIITITTVRTINMFITKYITYYKEYKIISLSVT